MAEVKSTICDLCGNPDATTYAIAKRPNTPWLVDLCATCEEPILATRGKGRRAQGKRVYRKYGKVPVKAK